MQGEDTFHTFVADHTADGEEFVDASAFAGDDGTGKDLDADLVAFHDSTVDVDGVANLELGNIRLEAFRFD